MFNRTVEFKVTKPNKPESTTTPKTPTERQEQLDMILNLAHNAAWDVAKLVGAYMIMDTWRKVSIAKAVASAACCGCGK